MKIVIFGTVIRTRRSMEKLLRQAVSQGKADSEIFKWGLHVYNTGIFGLLIYRDECREVGKEFFM